MLSNHNAGSGSRASCGIGPPAHDWAFVFGGGAARGIAHIGALQVLEENSIFPKVVVGTSVGALVGGLYAAGISSGTDGWPAG